MKNAMYIFAATAFLVVAGFTPVQAQEYEPLLPESRSVTPGDETPTPGVDRMFEDETPTVTLPGEGIDEVGEGAIPLPPKPETLTDETLPEKR